jgi:UDP-N-acetyl-D-glucosamine dehydrogenase
VTMPSDTTTERRPHPVAGSAELTVAVVGLGAVGLPTALALHAAGATVIGVDVDAERLAAIGAGAIDLTGADRTRLAAAQGDPDFGLGTTLSPGVDPDVVLICVPTSIDEHRLPDLAPLTAACAAVVAAARPGQLIVLSSTSYTGSTRDLLVEPLRSRGLEVGTDVHVAYSPERVDPGNASYPPDAVPRVVGGATAACTQQAANVLRLIVSEVHEVATPEIAEMAKLLENTFRAVNIALINEVADACRELALDPMDVIGAAATKPYGFLPFYPGPGAGGDCIPCDPHYLLWQAHPFGPGMPVVRTAMDQLAARPGAVVTRARDLLADRGRPLAGASVLVVGVSYKPAVSDVRHSPAVEILRRLADAGARVAYTDPRVPGLTLADGSRLASTPAPERGDWDLVLVHTLHPDVDLSWVDGGRAPVLDATYRLPATHRVLL